MSIKQVKCGKWRLEVDRKGIPRLRKLFESKSEAEIAEREYLQKHFARVKVSADDRTMIDLAELWHQYHGINLADGDRRFKCLKDIASALKNPRAVDLTPEMFVKWRYARLQAGLTEKSMNNQQGYLCSMYNKLHKLKVIDYQNPIAEVDFIKIQERQLSYLSFDQIDTLFEAIENGCKNESTWYVAQLCIRTGARWGEAEQLKFKQLHNDRVTYEFTKSKRTRTIPLEPDFYAKLMKFTGYKNPDNRIFTNCIGSFRRSVERSGLELPRGQCSHILRHTFASHFIMNGGNILTLQRILGHADITQTMRYAHLAPDHLNDAIKFNPMAAKWR